MTRADGVADAHTVSVIIATNRGGPLLLEAIASAQSQRHPPIEIVLIDDGAPVDAGLGTVADNYGIRYIRQPPSGLSAARNLGAAAAQGEWLAFLDDDDRWSADKFSEQFRALGNMPDAVACGSGFQVIDGSGSPSEPPTHLPVADRREILRGAAPQPLIGTMLIRRDVFEAVGGFDPRMPQSEDIDLTLRLLQKGPFASVPRPLMEYRRYPGNRSGGLDSAEWYIRSLRAQIATAKSNKDPMTVSLLTENLRGFRLSTAEGLSSSMLATLRAGGWRRSWREGLWGLRWIPLQMLVATTRRSASFAWQQTRRRSR